MHPGKGQISGEYLIVLAIIAAFVTTVALQGLQDQELNLALGAARHASLQYIHTQNPSLALAGLDYTRGTSTTTLRPRLYLGTTLVADPATLPNYRYAVLDGVRQTLRPAASLNTTDSCVRAATTTYCCCGG